MYFINHGLVFDLRTIFLRFKNRVFFAIFAIFGQNGKIAKKNAIFAIFDQIVL